MRALAVDLGSKRIGIAVSDALGLTVRPVETIRRSSLARDIARLKQLVHDLDAEAIVVGLPLRMDNTIGDAARSALSFAERLRSEIKLPVFTEDERLTSREADRIMIDQKYSLKDRRQRSDQFAAMIILRDFLSRTRIQN